MLRASSGDAFLSGALPQGLLKHMASSHAGGSTYVGGAAAGAGEHGTGGGDGGDSMLVPETPWLAARYPASLRDMLASRLELSLWTSYWRAAHKLMAPSRAPATPKGALSLGELRSKASALMQFWESLDPATQQLMVEGVALARECYDSARERRRPTREVVRRLLFTPVPWAYKDDGQVSQSGWRSSV